jgi:hypothetical protein
MGAKKEKVPVTFFDYKKYAIRAAKELLYPYEIVKKIRQAKNESEISHIMSNARKSNAVKELNKGKDEGKDEEQDG